MIRAQWFVAFTPPPKNRVTLCGLGGRGKEVRNLSDPSPNRKTLFNGSHCDPLFSLFPKPSFMEWRQLQMPRSCMSRNIVVLAAVKMVGGDRGLVGSARGCGERQTAQKFNSSSEGKALRTPNRSAAKPVGGLFLERARKRLRARATRQRVREERRPSRTLLRCCTSVSATSN